MMRELNGFDRVFSFTFAQHWKGKRFLRSTLIVAVLCLLLPALIMTLVEVLDDGEATPDAPTALAQIHVVDATRAPGDHMKLLRELGQGTPYANVTYRHHGDDLTAAAHEVGADALILYLTEEEGGYHARVLLPGHSDLDESDATLYAIFVNGALHYHTASSMGIDPARIALIDAPIEIAPHEGRMRVTPVTEPDGDEAPEVTPEEQVREILAVVLPYFNIMLLYFMVLFYGQNVANSVILEKTSKLVDTFLVTVRPGALVMGKLLAISLSGVLQLLLWLSSLLGGFGIGALIVRALSPDSTMGLLLFIDQIDLWGGVFSLPTLLISVLMLGGGFLMYCTLAAIGGAMASKPEELSSTNSLFSMVLVVSFLCTIYAGGMGAGMSSAEGWLNWVPFTAIFVTPSRVLLGELSLGGGLLSLGLVLAVTFALVLLAGKVYRMLILYKGNLLKLGHVVKMLLGRS